VAGEINPTLLTCAERIQYEGFLRREETDTTVRARHCHINQVKAFSPEIRIGYVIDIIDYDSRRRGSIAQ
jgi:hypothetical protein